MARSTWVAHAFEWEKLLKCHLKGKASRKLANGQNIDYSEKTKMAQGPHLPLHWGLIPLYSNMFIGTRICSRSQVSVYKTIGPLVYFYNRIENVSTLYNTCKGQFQRLLLC